MNFITAFDQSVSGRKMINMEADPHILLPNIYEGSISTQEDFFSLLGGGTCMSDYPFYFSFQPLNCSFLLYTLEGSGKISYEQTSLTLGEQHGFLGDCSKPFSLQTLVLPWKFKIFFFQGATLSSFRALHGAPLKPFLIPEQSCMHQNFSRLSGIPNQYSSYDALLMHKVLTDILCELYLCVLPSQSIETTIPQYLIELKHQLDYHYETDFSLSVLESTLKVNKYRLCREFSKTYGMPPLRYLNQKRMDAAKEILLTTDFNIHEISSSVGYENTNHFINLFKKNTGLTPNAFRRKALENQSVSRFPDK